jgi:hypothetical protein
MLLARSRLGGGLAGRLDVANAVGGALLGLDPFDSRAGSLPVRPLSRSRGSGPRARSGSVIW